MWGSVVMVLDSAVMACRLYSVGLGCHLFESEVLKEIVLASPSLCRRVGAYIWLPSSSAGKDPPARQETLVRFLGWEDPLEEGLATHSSILAWRIPVDRAWRAIVRGVAKSQTGLSN